MHPNADASGGAKRRTKERGGCALISMEGLTARPRSTFELVPRAKRTQRIAHIGGGDWISFWGAQELRLR